MELICIKTYSYKEEAELAKNLLEAKDIKAVVSMDNAGGSNPALGWATGGAKLMVKEQDKEKAEKILEDMKT